MGSFVVGALAPALRQRSLRFQLGLLVLTCILLFALLGPHSNRGFGASWRDIRERYQARIHPEPRRHTVNGLEVDPPPPPADEDEYVAICRSVTHMGLVHPLTYLRQVSS